jgi:hypothetical protein
MIKKLNLAFFLLTFFSFCAFSYAGQFSLGAEYLGWTTNYVSPDNGTEFWMPYSVSFNLDPEINIYGQGEYGIGRYTPSNDGPETTNLSDFSDTMIGTQFRFKSFGLPTLFGVGFSLPTGNPTWETQQIASNIPIEFVDSRYTGMGFGVNAMYGLDFKSGTGDFGAAAGYSYAGSYNPGGFPGTPTGELKLGDAVFLALNHVQPYSGNQSETIRLSAFYFLPTQELGQTAYRLGPNLNASYVWLNPKGLSYEAGVQYYLPAQRPVTVNGVPTSTLATEADEFLAPRFYLSPSYAFGDFLVGIQLKYILPNGYAVGNSYYDGGGLLAGLGPSYKLKLDGTSNLKFYGTYDFILHHNGGQDADLNYVDADYNLFMVGAIYELQL